MTARGREATAMSQLPAKPSPYLCRKNFSSHREVALSGTAILRPSQADGVAEIRVAFIRWRRVLFVLATGGGKTIIVGFITSKAAAKGNRVLVLAHRQE